MLACATRDARDCMELHLLEMPAAPCRTMPHSVTCGAPRVSVLCKHTDCGNCAPAVPREQAPGRGTTTGVWIATPFALQRSTQLSQACILATQPYGTRAGVVN